MADINVTAESLKPLIAEARRRNLWLFCPYQALWFSPDELEKQNANSKFLWSPENWHLRDPEEGLAVLQQKIKDAIDEMHRFQLRMAGI